MSSPVTPIIVALDYAQAPPALALARRLDPARCRLKVGKQLFTREGPAIIDQLREQGFEVFLDLKFHDIPNTVAGACRAAADLGVWMINVHASGGRKMMLAARESVDAAATPPLLIAVTVLTSLDAADLRDTGIGGQPAEQVTRLAKLTHECGLDGVVCSPKELETLAGAVPDTFLRVTPGVRPAGKDDGDQKRVATPAQALADGAHYLVIGRPITQAADPAAALAAIEVELSAPS
ncbi:MAG: orotidine-5'-phosphate decarboxylase [Gammaproteobacteria bacterium]|nr:orotidine-5'-phosphate decarboxylase [Gammaproteobacteria bacterium]NCF80066.1 orotidine-5'-phosphate decarboxylase [Pseudomonadota bacterium]